MRPIPHDYVERVYAGVLGKLIGVYVGRPFEGWTHQRILKQLGPIRHYVHERLGLPLVVVDDDVSGTFVFVRALDEHDGGADISAEAIGMTWLNQVVERRSVFWWGGRGVSTEHTAFLNLKDGIPAPMSGSMRTNGRTVAEQIGGQIFIDGWALAAPGHPALAARLAGAAASVSHDGEAIYAASLWAAMEAEAFVSKDVNHLIDVGMRYIPAESLTARLIAQLRQWVREDGSWAITRQRIEDTHGYDKFGGVCHVIPNHAVMIMALLYAPHDFDEAMHIVNTCGWDTDCNSGNLGCLVAIINGLSCFEDGGGPGWRGPLADRALISSADGGYSVNNAARIALDVANLGRRLAGHGSLPPPKGGAQFHFTLPGSVQGFQAFGTDAASGRVELLQAVDGSNGPGLAIRLSGIGGTAEPIEVLTPTFTPRDAVLPGDSTYDLMASPLLYPGQRVTAQLRADESNSSSCLARLRLKAYSRNDELLAVDGPSAILEPGRSAVLTWTVPDDMDSQPIQQIGIALEAAVDVSPFSAGTIWLDHLGWNSVPCMTLRRPSQLPCSFWQRAWVNAVDHFHGWMEPSFCIAKDVGEGTISQGTREWTDYRVVVSGFRVNMGGPAGVAVRMRGLRRYYALLFTANHKLALVKALDGEKIELATASLQWRVDIEYRVELVIQGSSLCANVDGTALEGHDDQYIGGAVGLLITGGSLSARSIHISPVVSC